jgi:hypothetical protein
MQIWRGVMKIRINNVFHHTTTTTTVDSDRRIGKSRVAHIRRSLCGIADCTCGGALSEQGGELVAAIEDAECYDILVFAQDSEGGGRFEYID